MKKEIEKLYNINWSDEKKRIKREMMIHKLQTTILTVSFVIVSVIALYLLIESGNYQSKCSGVIVNDQGVVGKGIN